MRQFVHLQDSSWRSLFRNSNFSAQCRIVSASRQIRTVSHDLSDRPAYPLSVILTIPLLLNPGNGVAALTDAFIHQRLSVSGASAPTTQPILQENYLLGKTFRLPYPQRVWSGLSNLPTTFQQTFLGISTSATAGAKGIASPPARAKRTKTSFHWKWTPRHFKQNGSLPSIPHKRTASRKKSVRTPPQAISLVS